MGKDAGARGGGGLGEQRRRGEFCTWCQTPTSSTTTVADAAEDPASSVRSSSAAAASPSTASKSSHATCSTVRSPAAAPPVDVRRSAARSRSAAVPSSPVRADAEETETENTDGALHQGWSGFPSTFHGPSPSYLVQVSPSSDVHFKKQTFVFEPSSTANIKVVISSGRIGG